MTEFPSSVLDYDRAKPGNTCLCCCCSCCFVVVVLLLYRDMIKMKDEKLCDVLGLNLIISPCSE